MNRYFITFLLLPTLFGNELLGSDTGRSPRTQQLGAGQPEVPVVQFAAVPMSIFQRSENHIECKTRSGETIRFRVKLSVEVKPGDHEAGIKLDIFQGTKLITSRNLDFFW